MSKNLAHHLQWWLEVVGVIFCVVEFSYFGLCKVPCREGLRSSADYLGDFINLGLEIRYLIQR